MDAFGQHIGTLQRFDDQLVDTTEQKLGTGLLTVNVQLPFIFGSLTKDLFEINRSYYANIIMPYGNAVTKALDTLEAKLPEIDRQNTAFSSAKEKSIWPRVLATAHGIVWRKHVSDTINHYRSWAKNEVLKKITIIYDTMYGR